MLLLPRYENGDELDPTGPSGHAYGIRKSSMLTSDYRKRFRRGIVDVTPEEVIACMIESKIRNWVLMGLHGYVGYLPMPRATQDVDVMVAFSEKLVAAKAIETRWPMLKRINLEQVVRFMDDTDLDPEGKPKPVIDLMLPWGQFQRTILKDHVIRDKETGSRYPTIEAALASKYAALVSPFRSTDKKGQDSVDFSRIVKANSKLIDRDRLRALGDQVWERGGDEVLHFVDQILDGKSLPGL